MVLPTLLATLSTAGVRRGDVIAGKYRVERLLGRGGMGIVVAATHVHLGERVAVKLLLPGSRITPVALARFLREGRAAARVKSEHVARVHDAGLTGTGEPYLVLEYLEGKDLRTLIKERGPLSVSEAVEHVLGVCEGLAEAHAQGVVHRDLKPANLFLARGRGGSPVVKIIDFGISKIASNEPSDGTGDTITGSVMGTPNYMAPEQMRAARDADARADIWSLGATLFGLLTGASPFPGESMIEVYDGVLKGAPSLQERRPEAPPELARVVERCLRLDPAERFQDVGELALALAELVPEDLRAPARRAVAALRTPPAQGPLPEDFGGSLEEGESTGPAWSDAFGTDARDGAEDSAQPVTQDAREPSWGARGVGAASPGGRARTTDEAARGGDSRERSRGGAGDSLDAAGAEAGGESSPGRTGTGSQPAEDSAALRAGAPLFGSVRIQKQRWIRTAMLAPISLAGLALIGIAATRDLRPPPGPADPRGAALPTAVLPPSPRAPDTERPKGGASRPEPEAPLPDRARSPDALASAAPALSARRPSPPAPIKGSPPQAPTSPAPLAPPPATRALPDLSDTPD